MKQSFAATKRNRTRRLAKVLTRSYYLYKRGKSDKVYSLICEEFLSLGGVYIKFLQGVLLRSEVMKRWHNPERLKIFENLESEPLNINAILQHELGPTKIKQITGVQPEPFAAGSFGQVYFGQHVNGKPIIIKVLRPMIRELLRHDLRLLSIFTKRFYAKLAPNMDLSINDAVRDFMNATLRETDYVAEADFANELYRHYKDHPKLIIPETFLNLCTPNIIVQEYVEGISAAQLIKLQAQGVDPTTYIKETIGSDLDKQLELLGYEAINGIFNLKRIQGDPHPGNVRLMPNNKVGIIDFGISATTPVNKAALFGLLVEWNQLYSDSKNISGLFEQFVRFFVSDLYRALKKLSTLTPSKVESENFTTEIGKVAQENFARATGQKDLGAMVHDGRILQLINQMINKDNRFGLVVRLEASEILRAAQTYIGLVETLGRRATVLPRVFDRVVKQVDIDHPALRHQAEQSMSMSDALETVSGWLERVAERDPALFRQLTERITLKRTADAVTKEPVNV